MIQSLQSITTSLSVKRPGEDAIIITKKGFYYGGRINVYISLFTIEFAVNTLRYNDSFTVQCRTRIDDYQGRSRMLSIQGVHAKNGLINGSFEQNFTNSDLQRKSFNLSETEAIKDVDFHTKRHITRKPFFSSNEEKELREWLYLPLIVLLVIFLFVIVILPANNVT